MPSMPIGFANRTLEDRTQFIHRFFADDEHHAIPEFSKRSTFAKAACRHSNRVLRRLDERIRHALIAHCDSGA
jgi:hypothetical protein